MTEMLDLLADLMDEIELLPSHAHENNGPGEARTCDGCFEAKDDVDVWATNSETGEVLLLCETCAEF